MISHRAVRAGRWQPCDGDTAFVTDDESLPYGEGLSALGRLACVSARSRAYFCISRRVLEGGGAAAAALIVQCSGEDADRVLERHLEDRWERMSDRHG